VEDQGQQQQQRTRTTVDTSQGSTQQEVAVPDYIKNNIDRVAQQEAATTVEK
jgi:hypothetical protein